MLGLLGPDGRKFAKDPKYIGATLGMLGVLQTWKRDLGYHPHAHYIIPGGGLAPDGKTWCPAKHDYLMPEKALAIIFRAKFRDGLKALGLHDQVPKAVWRKNWVVDIEPVGSGQEALKYLTPYIFRVAISNKNILKVTDKDVAFLSMAQFNHELQPDALRSAANSYSFKPIHAPKTALPATVCQSRPMNFA